MSGCACRFGRNVFGRRSANLTWRHNISLFLNRPRVPEIVRTNPRARKPDGQDAISGQDKSKSKTQIDAFEKTFETDFSRLYGRRSYTLPLGLTIATSIVFGLIYFGILGEFPPFATLPINGILLLSIAGALLGDFPAYVACYASTSLNANNLLNLIGKIWLSLALGFCLGLKTPRNRSSCPPRF